MKFSTPIALAAFALALNGNAISQAQAQTPAKPAPAKHATPAKPRAKPAPAKPVPPPPPPLPEADEDQLAAAQRAYLGTYDCEFKQTINISLDPKNLGYVDVHLLKQVYVMKPVLSSTGALRLEDVTGRTLMIQIANKSMLLDVKLGQRLVDDCISPQQRELMAQMAAAKAAAAASGIAPDEGLGIEIRKPAVAAAAAAVSASAAANAAASAASAAVQAAAVAASAADAAASAASSAASAVEAPQVPASAAKP